MTDHHFVHHADLGTLAVHPLETLLEASLRLGLKLPFSCRGGTCHTCMMRCTGGHIPERAQQGLAPVQKAQGLFLPCVCYPEGDMRVSSPGKPLPPRPDAQAAHLPSPVVWPAQDPALWHELGQGQRVRQVLDAFYAKVFADAQLAPYFQNTTPAHVAGKQYAFLYEAMTGEDVYFGDKPFNAHHAMVISDDLFDHRQRLMVETLVEHGLSDDQIRRWTAFEEVFRPDIVKTQVLQRQSESGTFNRPEGFAEEVLAVGSLCDHCGAEIPAGTPVLYHLQLGTISCTACRQRG